MQTKDKKSAIIKLFSEKYVNFFKNTIDKQEEKIVVTNLLENNHLVLVGKVTSDKTYSHEIYGEKFYIFNLEVPRLSQAVDEIPITISERLLTDINLFLAIQKNVTNMREMFYGCTIILTSIFLRCDYFSPQ